MLERKGEIEVPLFILRTKIPIEEKAAHAGLFQILRDVIGTNITFNGQKLSKKPVGKVPSNLIKHILSTENDQILENEDQKTVANAREVVKELDTHLSKEGREAISTLHDQAEMGAWYFALQPLAQSDQIRLYHPDTLTVSYTFSSEKVLSMETITSGIQKSPLVSTEKSDLLEAGGTIRTVLNVSKDASERKLFTDSYSLSNKLLNLFYKDKEYPEMSAQQKKEFLGFYCKIKIKKLEQLNSQLAKMEQKKSISGSIFSTSLDPAKETQKNEALILAFNDLAQMDSPVIIQQLLNTLRVNPRYIEEVHAPIHAKILLVKQHCANLKKLMIAENKAISQSNEIELVTLISTHVSQVLFELDQHWSHSFICNKYHEKYVSKPGTMVAASSDILQSMITKLSEQHTQLTTIIEKATQSNPEITP